MFIGHYTEKVRSLVSVSAARINVSLISKRKKSAQRSREVHIGGRDLCRTSSIMVSNRSKTLHRIYITADSCAAKSIEAGA